MYFLDSPKGLPLSLFCLAKSSGSPPASPPASPEHKRAESKDSKAAKSPASSPGRQRLPASNQPRQTSHTGKKSVLKDEVAPAKEITKKKFVFDHVFDGSAAQSVVFGTGVKNAVAEVADGHVVSIFCYG